MKILNLTGKMKNETGTILKEEAFADREISGLVKLQNFYISRMASFEKFQGRKHSRLTSFQE